MCSLTTHLKVLVSAAAVLLGTTGSALLADVFTWDNTCLDDIWHTCCDVEIDGDPLRENNWAEGASSPGCPPLPEAGDDVIVGANFVILGSNATVNGFASAFGGVFQFEAGVLSVATNATYDGTINWLGGVPGGGFGSGLHSIHASLIISGAATKILSGGTVNHHDTATWTGTGAILFQNAGTFNNLVGATFDARNDAQITRSNGLIGAFNNAGTFLKSAGEGATLIAQTRFNNTGTVNVQSGRLELDKGGTSSSVFSAVAGTSVDFTGDLYTLEDGASFTGEGFGRIIGATVTVTIPDAATVTAENFELQNGNLKGLGNLSVSDTFNWTVNGRMADAGMTTIEETATMNISGSDGKILSQRTVNNAGNSVWTDTGTISFQSSATFNNLAGATFDARSDAQIFHTSGPASAFNNAGTFLKSAGEGTVSPDLSNAGGEVAPGLSEGTLTIGDDYTQTATGTLDIEIGGVDPGVDHDVLQVADVASLDGTLNVSLINGYTPVGDERFTILTATTVTGVFASENLPALPGDLIMTVQVETDRVILAVDYDCNGNNVPDPLEIGSGDLDGDGDVDLFDYEGFLVCITEPCGSPPCEPPLYADPCCALADMDADGDVDLVDIGAFQLVFTGE